MSMGVMVRKFLPKKVLSCKLFDKYHVRTSERRWIFITFCWRAGLVYREEKPQWEKLEKTLTISVECVAG